MLVRKIDPEWSPIENTGLKVGETVDITDPKQLVLSGRVEIVDENGVVVSPYELYGELVGGEKDEFQEWLALKRQEKAQQKLSEEKKELEAKLAESKPEVKPEVKPVTKTEKVETKKNAKK